ncbi:CotH kinase family protein [Aquimarina sp. M1]
MCVLISGCAKSQIKIKPVSHSFGIDNKRKIIVWHCSDRDSIPEDVSTVLVSFANSLTFKVPADATKYKSTYQQKAYTLYITKLPLIHINTTDTIADEPKKPTQFIFYEKQKAIQKTAGIELRGNISQKFPKKTYDIEFWKDTSGKENINVKFKKMRNDDDWILDGLYNEPLRLRSYLASKLWLSIHKPTYRKNPKANSGIDVCYTEVFFNSEYKGIFTLSEQVDEKLLRLKDPDTISNKITGALYKASGYEGATMFKKLPDFNNIFPHWGGYEMEFPVIEYTYYWDELYAFTDFVLSASAEDFKNTIDQKININNTIDYFLLMNLLRATDNLGKNFYIAKADIDAPFFLVPWDLDGVLGTIIDGRHIATTDDILSNGLFDRLIKENPNNYKAHLSARWQSLRENEFSNQKLHAKIDTWFTLFKDHRIYEREEKVWQPKISKEEELSYLKDWLKKRLLFLDGYFREMR